VCESSASPTLRHARYASSEQDAVTNVAESAPDMRRRGGTLGRVLDYWPSMRAAADTELAKVGQGLVPAWSLVGESVVVASVLVVILHAVTALLLYPGSLLVQTLALLPVGLLALVCVWALTSVYRETRKDPNQTGPVAVGLLMATVTIGVAMQAFATFDVYLAKRGVVPGGAPSLLSAEESYAWHLLDAVPFLHVTETLRWGEPAVLRDVLSGLMLLVFKVAVIAPFIGVVLAGYHMLERLVERPTRVSSGMATLVFALAAPLVAALWVGSSVVFDRTSHPNRWLNGRLEGGLDIPSFEVPIPDVKWISDRLPEQLDVHAMHVPTWWVATLPQWLATTVLFAVVAVVFILALQVDVEAARRRWRMLGPVGAYVCLVLLLTAFWSVLTLTLLHSRAVTASRAIPAGDELERTTEYYLWHAADVVPVVDLPATMHWSLHLEYVDAASVGLLLAYKLAILVVLAFPLMRVVRTFSPPARAAQQPGPDMLAAQDYTARLGSVERALDAADEKAASMRRRRRGRSHPAPDVASALAAARTEVDNLNATLTELRTLRGEDETTRAAVAAANAAQIRFERVAHAVDRARRGEPLSGQARKALPASRSMLEAAANGYRRTAVGDLRAARTRTPEPRAGQPGEPRTP
jgi:hypothetical protein